MKKYYVSLAGKKNCNLVWNGTAKNEKDALRLALEAVDNGEAEVDDDWGDVELDVGNINKLNPKSSGVWIEKR